jgi:Spy/CpxP family protein refolding chaperone
MKSLKAILAATALAVAFTAPLQAQEKKKGGGGGTPEQQIERIEQAVGSLSAEQKKKITAIIEKSNSEMQAIPKEDRKEKGGAVTAKRTSDIKAVLTPEQAKKYDEAMAAMKKKN